MLNKQFFVTIHTKIKILSYVTTERIAKYITNPKTALWLSQILLRLGMNKHALILAKNFLRLECPLPADAPCAPKPPLHKSDRIVEVSVIIPTCNRAESLNRLLESLKNQNCAAENFEVIVVNNASSDHTDEICRRHSTSFKNFTVVNEKKPGLLAARHAGWAAASSNILTFCDDDIEPNPLWLSTIIGTMQSSPNVMLMGGNNTPTFEVAPPAWMDELWHEAGGVRYNPCYSLITGIKEVMEAPLPDLVFGCNYTVRRQALEAALGFQPDIMPKTLLRGGGESGIIAPMLALTNGKVLLHPDASVKHHMPAARLSHDYLYKRGIAITISALYEYFRCQKTRSGLISYNRQHPVALQLLFAAQQAAFKAYLHAVLSNQELRAWINLPSYLGNESPEIMLPDDAFIFGTQLKW